MKGQLLHRLLLMFSAMVLMLIFCFMISRLFPGEKLVSGQTNNSGLQSNEDTRKKLRERAFRMLGYDQPLFYFSVSSFAVPDSFTRMPDAVFRNTLKRVAYLSGQPGLSYKVCTEIVRKYGEVNPFQIGDPEEENLIVVRADLQALRNDRFVLTSVEKLNKPYFFQSLKKFIPRISFTTRNQFHAWLFGSDSGNARGILQGDFGRSLTSGMPVVRLLKFSFCLSFLFALFNLLISIPLGVFIGSFMAIYRRASWVNVVNTSFLFFYNIPSFLFAITLVFLFANPEMLNLFPSSGPVLNTSEGFSDWIVSLITQWKYLVLPLFVLSSSSIVFVSQLVYETLLDELEKPYSLTLKAMGYSEKYLLRHQLLRNTILPVIVTMAGLFPSLISGSMLIDYFFSLNGLGGVLMKASEQLDLPVMVGIFVVVGIVSIFTLYLIDFLLKKIDPRVSLKLNIEGGEA